MSVVVGKKKFIIKIFSSNYATHEGTLDDARVSYYASIINGGMSQFAFSLDRTIRDSLIFTNISLGKIIELWVDDVDTNGTYIREWVGYVSRIDFLETPTERSMSVSCLGFVSRLSKDVLKNGTQTTLYSRTSDYVGTTSTPQSVDPSNLFRGVVRRLRDVSDGNIPFINYNDTSATIDATGLSVQMIFEQKSYYEALELVRKACPPNWYWRINANNEFELRQKPTVATHTFGLGSIQSLEVGYSMEDMVNGALVWDGDTTYRYIADANSVTAYGRLIKREVASSAKDTAAMDKAGYNLVGEGKDPRSVIVLTVADDNELQDLAVGQPLGAGYNIENIEAGDTCRISGISDDSARFLSVNMTIMKVTKYPDHAVLEIDARGNLLAQSLLDISNSLTDKSKKGLPTTYTAV